MRRTHFSCLAAAVVCAAVCTSTASAQTTQTPFQPQVGQPGKDVVWVPTPDFLVEKMLDLAKVTPQDQVVDLGSGDGRMIIAAAKRGARSLGVEYNPDMVAIAKKNAEQQGVADKAQFVQGDMYVADFSHASVLALFLLPDNLNKLRPKFLELRPGTRIVSNTFSIADWTPDETQSFDDSGFCQSWCTALLWVVPAKVQGTWQVGQGVLTLEQSFQMLSGGLKSGSNVTPINGRLRGNEITFTAGGAEYTGRVNGDSIAGTVMSGGTKSAWSATRLP